MAEGQKPWFCYMVCCKGGLLYVGIATDVAGRVKEHNWGGGAVFTAKRRPVELIWWEKFSDQREAREKERELKGWRREKKLHLAAEFRQRIHPSAAGAASG